MNKAKKRSPNYTQGEKQMLLSLVTKHKDIIESKKTDAHFIQRKNNAWAVITRQYNSFCTTGPRNTSMLRHFYNNVKHRAKKHSAPENNQTDQEIATDNFKSSEETIYENIESYKAMLPILNVEIVTDDPIINPLENKKVLERKKKVFQKTEYMQKSADTLKKIYYKKKIELTYYKKRNELVKFRHEHKRHELEVKKLELEIEILKKSLNGNLFMKK